MTGLDRIIEKILLQSQENCNAILNEASLEVKKIISEAREKANKESFLRGQLIGQSNASSCCIAHLINEITFKQSSAACDADRQ